MKNRISEIRQSFHHFRKSVEAMKQSNITLGQMPYVLKEIRLWWQIARNLKDLQGSWTGALKAYLRIFQGVPRKKSTPENQ